MVKRAESKDIKTALVPENDNNVFSSARSAFFNHNSVEIVVRGADLFNNLEEKIELG